MKPLTSFVALILLLRAAPLLAVTDEPIIPSSPHRVLFVDNEIDSYYLVEPDKPLTAYVEGPGLVEMRLRRIIWVNDPPVQATSLQVSLDDHVQPPVTFRRAREEKVRFIDEPRFVPSVARTTRLAVPSGSSMLTLHLGSDTQGVAVALRFRPAPEVSDLSTTSRLPPLAAIRPAAPGPASTAPRTTAASPSDASFSPTSVHTVERSEASTATRTVRNAAPEQEAPGADEPVAATNSPAYSDASAAVDSPAPVSASAVESFERPLHLELGWPQLGDHALAQIDLSFGLSSTFINLGRSAPGLSIGVRYPLPWLSRQLALGLRFSVSRYAFVASVAGQRVLDAEVWVVPLKLSVSYSPKLYGNLHSELGAGLGLAIHSASVRYREQKQSSVGLGPSGDVHAELGWHLPWGVPFGRLQLDAIGAGSSVVKNFDYLGASVALGYRVTL